METASHEQRVERLNQALDRRLASQKQTIKTNAYRLINGPADLAPAGLTIDRYQNWLVISSRTHLSSSIVNEWINSAEQVFKPEGIVHKRIAPSNSQSTTQTLSGQPKPIHIYEGDATFECILDKGMQTGLFLDHRETRILSQKYTQDKEVLNLFSYTCAFSVQAALSGSHRVTSVDVSKKALNWGRKNMTLSKQDPNKHRWFADDVLQHIKKTRRSYGLVILDPPVFGHGQKAFSLEHELTTLVIGSVNQLAKDGVLVLSIHHLEYNHQSLIQVLEHAGVSTNRGFRVLHKLGLPQWDHPVLPGHKNQLDRGDYLSTVIAQFE